MKQAITLAIIACTFVNGAVLQNKLAQCNPASTTLSQGVIASYASGVQAEIDQTNQTISDIECESSYTSSEAAAGTEVSAGHGCEVARRLYKLGGTIDYAENVETVEAGQRAGEY